MSYKDCLHDTDLSFEDDIDFITKIGYDLNSFDSLKWCGLIDYETKFYVFERYFSDDDISEEVFEILSKSITSEDLLYLIYDSEYFVRTAWKIKYILEKCELKEPVFLLIPSNFETFTIDSIQYTIDNVKFQFSEFEIRQIQLFYEKWDNEALNYLWDKYPELED